MEARTIAIIEAPRVTSVERSGDEFKVWLYPATFLIFETFDDAVEFVQDLGAKLLAQHAVEKLEGVK